jgi:hypothetical protein
MQWFKNTCKHDDGWNKEISQLYMLEDQERVALQTSYTNRFVNKL